MMELRERKRKNSSPDEKMMKRREKKYLPPLTTKATRDYIPRKLISGPISPGERKRSTGKKDHKKYTKEDLEREFLENVEKEKQQIQQNLERFRKETLAKIFAGGFVFDPTEVQLLKCCLVKKNHFDSLAFCPIVEFDNNPYALHPQDLLVNLAGLLPLLFLKLFFFSQGKSGRYFFTTSRPNEIQSSGDIAPGQWTFTDEMNKVLDQNQQIGVKKVYEYCERDGKGKYKVIEYQLDPTPAHGFIKTCPWFLCQLIYYDDVSCGCAA